MDYRPILQRVIDTIESSLESDINLAELSEQAHISVYHFSRLFMVYTGLPPMEYVRRRSRDNQKRVDTYERAEAGIEGPGR